MESIWAEFPTLDTWETSVAYQQRSPSRNLQADGFPISTFVAGAGKSVIWYVVLLVFPSCELTVLVSSTIVKEIETMRKSGLASLAIFYYDFREDQKKDLCGFLSSILVQLCRQSDSYCTILSKLYSEHNNGTQDPGNVTSDARWDIRAHLARDQGHKLGICPTAPPMRRRHFPSTLS